MLQNDYRVILPILDGHADSDRSFTTIEDNAADIISFVDEHLGGSVLLMGGLSLGGQILLEMLSQRKDICKYAIIESALVVPSKITYSLIKPAFGNCYGLIQQKWFSKFQFKSLRIKQTLFDDYFRDTCKITKQNMVAFLEANSSYYIKNTFSKCTAKIYVFVGERENHAMRLSAKMIHEEAKEGMLNVLPNLYHGEFSINYAVEYTNALLDIISAG